ncbi:MAG: osmoprotectant transport system permease protein [Candidatus Azotimanducaceae bacterium]|jgi:osmoprotectant transport system permease protein
MRHFAKLRLFLIFFSCFSFACSAETIRVASKNFNENYLLAEIMSQLLEIEGYQVERKFGLGGTLVCYEALTNNEVDIYAEYSGTLEQAILKGTQRNPSRESLNERLNTFGLSSLGSFGFNNTYAITMKEKLAGDRGLSKVSDLASETDLAIAFSLEFLNREDGWPGLSTLYNLTQSPIGIDHGLAYKAIDDGKIDITDAYSTDGDLARYQLIVLEDDKAYFPQYFAAPLVRNTIDPLIVDILSKLEGRIDDDEMRRLNARVIVDGLSFADVAKDFLSNQHLGESQIDENQMWQNLMKNTLVHLKLTSIALALGCLIGLPLGILVFRHKRLARATVYITGLLQTIPSIALLALMIPIFGIGQTPAIIALFLYSLLPIVRNTTTALMTIDPLIKRIAEAIGLTRFEQLRFVLVPLALPNILAGIKTAAIISIGTATLAAFIGAGGLGEPIVTGLALNDSKLILQGALPAAGLAIMVELIFEFIEKMLVKEHMLRELPQ